MELMITSNWFSLWINWLHVSADNISTLPDLGGAATDVNPITTITNDHMNDLDTYNDNFEKNQSSEISIDDDNSPLNDLGGASPITINTAGIDYMNNYSFGTRVNFSE